MNRKYSSNIFRCLISAPEKIRDDYIGAHRHLNFLR